MLIKILAMLAIFFLVFGCSKPPESTVNLLVDEEPAENSCALKIQQQGRERPKYEGLAGYIAIPTSYFNDRLPPEAPWQVDVLKLVGPSKWVHSGEKLTVKSPVTIVSANVYHSGYGMYKGKATVRMKDGSLKVINSDFFVRSAWWNCSVSQATRYSPVIVESIGTPKIVESNGDWGNLTEKELLFCKGGAYSGISAIKGNVWCKRLDGKKRNTHVMAKESDLKIVY